jgi:hypothetical protein
LIFSIGNLLVLPGNAGLPGGVNARLGVGRLSYRFLRKLSIFTEKTPPFIRYWDDSQVAAGASRRSGLSICATGITDNELGIHDDMARRLDTVFDQVYQQFNSTNTKLNHWLANSAQLDI